MHPTVFFENVRLFDKNIKCIPVNEMLEKLKSVHPRNFISTDIMFYISELDVSYDTKKGNRKTTKKYAIQRLDLNDSTDISLQAKIQAEADINKYNTIHKDSELKNFKIENAEILTMAVLRIE